MRAHARVRNVVLAEPGLSARASPAFRKTLGEVAEKRRPAHPSIYQPSAPRAGTLPRKSLRKCRALQQCGIPVTTCGPPRMPMQQREWERVLILGRERHLGAIRRRCRVLGTANVARSCRKVPSPGSAESARVGWGGEAAGFMDRFECTSEGGQSCRFCAAREHRICLVKPWTRLRDCFINQSTSFP